MQRGDQYKPNERIFSVKIEQTGIKDLLLVQLDTREDFRGYFARTYCRKEFSKVGINDDFVQMNLSYNKLKGTVRGLHFQIGKFAEIKYVRCVRGAIFDVVVDLRKESESFLEIFSIELSELNGKGLIIPRGCAHGFQTLENDVLVTYCHSEYYSPGNESGVLYNDPLLSIKWPLVPTSISERDKGYINLNNTL